MSTLDAPSRVTRKRQEPAESDDRLFTLYARAWEFYHHNRVLVYGALVALLVIIGALVAYAVYQNQQGEEAQQLLGNIVTVYEQGNYQQALEGTQGTPGLLTIADEYGGTQSGNLARFYAADALYQLGEYDRALEYFQAFDKEENVLGASAYAGEAAVYENQGEYETAGDRYRQAATVYESEATSPRYLIQAGRAYEEAGAYEEARQVFQQAEEDWPDSDEAQQVDMYLARVNAKANAAS